MKLFICIWLLAYPLCAQAAPSTESSSQPSIKLSKKDIEGKSLQDLWLMRNEIYARHGRPFSTSELNSYFQGKGFQPDPKYSDSRLTSLDKTNLALIQGYENKLVKQNYLFKGVIKQLNFDNIINRFQFGNFSEKERSLISAAGFMVTPAKYRQLFHVYEENDYAGVGSFITVDTVLQLYHMYFDFSLRAIEEQALYPRLKQLSSSLLEVSRQTYQNSSPGVLREAAKRNEAFFSVAVALASETESPEVKKLVPFEARDMVAKEIQRCHMHSETIPPAILASDTTDYPYYLDYTQFVPRGHYTRTETLSKYFLAMMWYGQFSFHAERDEELLQAILMADALNKPGKDGKALHDQWDELYRPTILFAGLSDDIGPNEVMAATNEACPKCELKDFADHDKLDAIRKTLRKMAIGKGRIGYKPFKDDSHGPEIRFMGQRFTPDSDIMQRLVQDLSRPKPMGLDVMSVLGSQVAKELMLTKYKDTWANWPEYPKELEKLIKEYQQLEPQKWTQNFYWQWLWTMKALLGIQVEGRPPFFMQNQSYKARSLNSALATWAQLRHDTILYAKQSVAAECGGGDEDVQRWIPDPPKGYVEPNLEFYRRLLDLLSFTTTELNRLGVSVPISSFKESVEFLKQVSEKELQNKPLSLHEYEQMRTFGSLLDHMTLGLVRAVTGLPGHAGWASVGGADQEIATIADVHTVLESGLALEEGVGHASEIYVAVEIDGRLKLLRGAVLSYYEFYQPMQNRLTDEQWQEMLSKDSAPARPEWIDSFFIPTPHIMPKPSYVLDQEIKDSSEKGDRGWRTITYETGS